MYNHKIYLIETITNTCVGSGDITFGIVDILIQRDHTTSLPIFNSSSVKGAIREHCENKNFSPEEIKLIFGDEKYQPGLVKFYEARLLTLPLRATKKVFYSSTSKFAILDYLEHLIEFLSLKDAEELKKFIEGLDFDDKEFIIFEKEKGLEIEDYESYKIEEINEENKNLIKKYLDLNVGNLALFKDEIFKDICENSIPVIARNKIGENGKSENLFYEEVLPRRSKLWLMIGFNKNIDENLREKLETVLKGDFIQFGGNASIGYGMTKIKEIGG